jgi:bacillithiol system protein YtxJ
MSKLNWLALESEAQLKEIQQQSHETPCLIFKHSTTCNISAIAKYRLEDDWDFKATELPAYYLDLLRFRPVSNQIADIFQVYHESPQVLLLVDGECVYDASHLDISVEELKEALTSLAP